MYNYDEALTESIEYFNGDELAAKVFLDKYAIRDIEGNLMEKTPDQMHRRIAKEFARIEQKKFKTPLSEEKIFGYLDKFKYIIPQGSPLYGIGNPYQVVSLSNCYVVPSPLDSYSSICYTDQELVQISKRRGGVGIDMSNLRPEGAPTKNAARSSTGIISFMERYSNSIREVGQEGRRGALMLTLNIMHPQSPDFAVIKNDDKRITGANISLRLTNEFLNAVEKKEKITLRWPVDSDNPKITKEVDARELWKTIIHSAWLRAEPGLLFWDNIIKNSPSDCYENFKTICTNPCSEIPLSAYDSCRLMLINLFSFVTNPFTEKAKFDYDAFKEVIIITQRLMDDMIDLEIECIDKIISKIKSDPEPQGVKQLELDLWKNIKQSCVDGRRTGTGITALGDTLAALGVKYGSDESIKKIEKIYRVLKLESYRSSVNMSKELGAFSCYDPKKELDCEFIKRLRQDDEDLYKDMVKYGRRNIALLTTAPAGSVSILTQTTSGIEPLFMLNPYIRRKKINPNDKDARIDFTDQSGDSWQEFEIYHEKVKEWMKLTGEKDIKKSPWYKCCAEDLDWKQRVKLQSMAQKHVDHAISSTLNLPENVMEEKIAEIYETAWKEGCKGITVYRKNCRTGVLIEKENVADVDRIQKTSSPKRPEKLPGELHHITVDGHHYYTALGFYQDDLYEIFTGDNQEKKENLVIPKDVKYGKIAKRSRGKYVFEHLNEETKEIEEYHLTNGHNDDSADALARMISTGLRHGADLSFIVHQLEKTEGSMVSFSKVLARTLKKHIKNGTKVSGEECSVCNGSNLHRQEGCSVCKDCGASKCS